MRSRLLRLGIGVSILIAGAGIWTISVPEYSRVMIDRAWHALYGAERKIRYRLGLPLRGTPDITRLEERLAEKGVWLGAPVFLRIFKRDYELELWMKKGERFILFATYPVCAFSGKLGPKLEQGDRQAPEGFYTVSRGQLNPNSRWHRSFNLGYPNAFDRAHHRTGNYLMVHGGCASAGCYAMTNPVIDEIWRLVTAALDAGQKRFAVHVFPFRMTDARMRIFAGHRWAPFWRDLKQGFDLFESTKVPPRISVCERRYLAEPGREGDDGSRALIRHCPAGV